MVTAPIRKPQLLVVAGAMAILGCNPGERGDTGSAPGVAGAESPPRVQASALRPGGAARQASIENPYAGDREALLDGARLYDWYNCSGCHAAGGGGMGPPLMDAHWIYGARPVNIFDSIYEGRAGGMPAFGGLIPEEQIWKIAAYVASLEQTAAKAGAQRRPRPD
jgi:cytochrome c oxidase cbb3-type subunit 3